jgi:hypothetical protein
MQSSGEACLDHGLAPVWSRVLAMGCRLAEPRVRALDLAQLFPGMDLSWFVHGSAAPRRGRFVRTSGYRGWVAMEAQQDPAKAAPKLYTEKAYHFIRKLITG